MGVYLMEDGDKDRAKEEVEGLFKSIENDPKSKNMPETLSRVRESREDDIYNLRGCMFIVLNHLVDLVEWTANSKDRLSAGEIAMLGIRIANIHELMESHFGDFIEMEREFEEEQAPGEEDEPDD